MEITKIHEDERGLIEALTGLSVYEEVTLFFTKKGKARGGCVHHIHDEYCVVIEGCVDFFLNDYCHRMKVGQSVLIPKHIPHYFIAITDCIVAEWGATKEEKRDKHIETRKLVDEINVTI